MKEEMRRIYGQREGGGGASGQALVVGSDEWWHRMGMGNETEPIRPTHTVDGTDGRTDGRTRDRERIRREEELAAHHDQMPMHAYV